MTSFSGSDESKTGTLHSKKHVSRRVDVQLHEKVVSLQIHPDLRADDQDREAPKNKLKTGSSSHFAH